MIRNCDYCGVTYTPSDEFKGRYRKVKTPDGRNVLEHRWVMEQHLGRRLESWEQVHHLNPVTKTCEVCGVGYTPHKTKRARQRTCGNDSCRTTLIWQTRRAKAAG